MCIITEHAHAKKRIVELEAKLAELENAPELKPCGTIDINLMSSILLNKLEEMKDDHAELYLADKDCKIYNKEEVKAFLSLDETDKIVFVAERQDCDDFAAELFGNGISLVWSNLHALNWFIDETEILWFIEPQTDQLAQNLENWQGWDIRMFLSR